MLYGITASDFSTPPVVPPFTGRGLFNFKSSIYSWDGTTLAASDVTDKTAWIGAGGLQVPGAEPAGAALLYSSLTAFLAAGQFTVAFEIETNFDGRQCIIGINSVDEEAFFFSEYWGAFRAFDEGTDYANRNLQDNVNAQSSATFKVAITRVDARLSMSVEGAAILTSTDSVPLPWSGHSITQFFLGNSPVVVGTDAVNIHWMKVYDAVADVDLPALSA